MASSQNSFTAQGTDVSNTPTHLFDGTIGNIEQTVQFNIRKAISISPGFTLNPNKYQDDTYFLILRGLVGKIDTRTSQRRKLATIHYAGDLIRLNSPHDLPTIYTALTPVKLIPIKKEVFYESLQKSHEFCAALYFQIVSESTSTLQKQRTNDSKRAQRAVCNFLLNSLARESIAQYKEEIIEFPFNNALLAEFLELSLVQLQSATKQLADLNIITVLSNFNIGVEDTKKLRKFYEEDHFSNIIRFKN